MSLTIQPDLSDKERIKRFEKIEIGDCIVFDNGVVIRLYKLIPETKYWLKDFSYFIFQIQPSRSHFFDPLYYDIEFIILPFSQLTIKHLNSLFNNKQFFKDSFNKKIK